MTEDDEWVQIAMSEDDVVVDMLLKLKQGFKQPLLRLHWSVRQPRSKGLSKSNNTRASSPTTPLSWSANTTSGSAGPDAFEDSTPPPPPPLPLLLPRSKVAVASDAPAIKRSRKKKTLAVLREEESLLQKERINLKEQLRTLRLNIEKQIVENSGLKKLKLDLLSRRTVETLPASSNYEEAKLNQPRQRTEASNTSRLVLSTVVASSKLDPSLASQYTPSHQLPDLNIPAEEDDSCHSFLYGLSC